MKEVMGRLCANLKGMAKEGVEIFSTYDGDGEQLLHCDLHLIEEVADNLFKACGKEAGALRKYM